MIEPKKLRTAYKVYLLIASLVGLVGSLIAGGAMLTTIGDRVLISNKENIAQQKTYGNTNTEDQLIFLRNFDFKRDVLRNSIRTVLFLLVFFTHYPRFRKQND